MKNQLKQAQTKRLNSVLTVPVHTLARADALDHARVHADTDALALAKADAVDVVEHVEVHVLDLAAVVVVVTTNR